MSQASSSQLLVRQTRSTANRPEKQRLVLKGLGLHGIGTEVRVANTPSFRGMVIKVLHLVEVQEVAASASSKKESKK